MGPVAGVMLGSAVVGGLGGLSSASKARSLGRAQSKLKLAETYENVRRMKLNADRALGLTESRVAASNMMMSGSQQKYTQDLETQLMQDIDWTKKKGEMEAKVLRRGGSSTASSITSSAAASMLGYTAQAINAMG